MKSAILVVMARLFLALARRRPAAPNAPTYRGIETGPTARSAMVRCGSCGYEVPSWIALEMAGRKYCAWCCGPRPSAIKPDPES